MFTLHDNYKTLELKLVFGKMHLTLRSNFAETITIDVTVFIQFPRCYRNYIILWAGYHQVVLLTHKQMQYIAGNQISCTFASDLNFATSDINFLLSENGKE